MSWFEQPLGRSVIQSEIDKFQSLIPSGYYPRSLQIGMSWEDYLFGAEVGEKYLMDTAGKNLNYGLNYGNDDQSIKENCHHVVSASCAIPFPEKSQNLVVLPHTLDLCDNPHEVLRQSSQVLVPEGCMVIAGFNLMSLYGVFRLLKRQKQAVPWNGKFYSVGRIQDWLSLLGFDLVGAGMINYKPPFQSEKWREKLAVLEKAGDRWWPGFGGVYVIVGRKREMGMTSLQQPAKTWHHLIPGIARPATASAAAARSTISGSAPVRLRLVSKS